MRIERGRIVRVSGSTPGAANARQDWRERSGLHLELVEAGGALGWGEASPLPGYSWESLELAEAELIGWLQRLPRELPDPEAIFVAAAEVAAASARFALETALLDLLGQEEKKPLHQLLGSRPRATPLPLVHLLPVGAEISEVLAAAERLAAAGATAFKIKIGGPDFAAELALLAALRQRFGDAVELRLDANRAFKAAELKGRLDALAVFSPELLEEPVGEVDSRTAAIDLASPFPLAFDETLQDPVLRTHLPRLLRLGSFRVLVLKPMALGGFVTCLELARTAQACGCATLVSHLFDGPIGLAAAAHLAFALPGRILPCGLARHSGLGIWSGEVGSVEPAFVGPGEISLPQAPGLWGERRA